jgi:hypothetical protein
MTSDFAAGRSVPSRGRDDARFPLDLDPRAASGAVFGSGPESGPGPDHARMARRRPCVIGTARRELGHVLAQHPIGGYGAIRGEWSGGGRMKDGGLLSGGAAGWFLDHSDPRRGALEDRQGRQVTPLVDAVRVEKNRWDRHGDSARATRARARRGAIRPLVFDQRIFGRKRGGRAVDDECVEPVEIAQPVGPRRDEVVTAGPGGTRRRKAVEQEQR